MTYPVVRGILAWGCGVIVVTSLLGCSTTPMAALGWSKKPTIASVSEALKIIRQSGDPNLRLEAFAFLGDPELYQGDTSERDRVVHILALALEANSEAQTRVTIAESLGRLGSPESVSALLGATGDEDPLIRAAACRALVQRPVPESTEKLHELLRSDPDLDVRLAVADSLGNLRNRDAALALTEGLNDPDVAVRYRCRESLKIITGNDYGENPDQWRDPIRTASFLPEYKQGWGFGQWWVW